MVTIRKIPLVSGEIYHIFNKSIAEYKIFNNEEEFIRMKGVIRYYQWEKREVRFSKWKAVKKEKFFKNDIEGKK